MTRTHSVTWVVLAAFALACAAEDPAGDDDGSGGTSATGGTSGTGGKAGASTGGSAGSTNARGGTGGTAANGGSGAGGDRGGTAGGGLGGSAVGGAGSSNGGAGNGAVAGTGGSDLGGAGSGGSAGSSGGAGTAGGSGEPGVRIVGRTTPGSMGGDRFSWSGTSFQARFSGTQISMQLVDGNNQNEFAIVIDGDVSKVATVNGTTTYPLATGLAEGTHDIVVWRRSEAYYNPSEFLGFTDFSDGGALLPPAPAPDRRIELIGDSISAGYGNEGTNPCTASQANENNYAAYGSVAARLLDADLVTVAWSGIGMYRNYNEDGPSAGRMSARYDSIIPTDTNAPAWDFTKYTPQVVVINLGTNDYSTRGDPGLPFVVAYSGFLQHVRDNYPEAYIFCLIPLAEAADRIDAAVATLTDAGDTAIEAFDISVSAGANDGCDGHPNLARDQAMGEKLATRIQTVMSWD